MAARTVYDAVDAATSATPVRPSRSSTAGTTSKPQPVRSGTVPRDTLEQAVRSAGRVGGSVRAARQSVLAPVKRASRAVSLEITGSFFAIFAVSFSAAAWRFRGTARVDTGHRLWLYVGLAAVFGYFALSSFLRARRIFRA